MYTGPGMVSNDDIYDIIKNIAYNTILEKYRKADFTFLIMNDNFFSMPMAYKRPTTFAISKHPYTKELLTDNAPVTFEQATALMKRHWDHLFFTLSEEVQDFVVQYALDLSFPPQNRPKDFTVSQQYIYSLKDRIQKNNDLNKQFIRTVKGLRASITHEGYSRKKVVNVFAGKYINWLGREDSQYLYAKIGKHVTAETYNLLQRDRAAYKKYMEDPRTKNWTIAVSVAIGKTGYVSHARLDSPGDFTSKYKDHKTTVSRLIEYAKHHWLSLCPYLEDKVFQNLSPRLIKDTYHKYPQQLHRLVALIAETDIDIPTYTMCKMLIYKERHMHMSTIATASALSHAATNDYCTTQQDAWNQFKYYLYSRTDQHYNVDINHYEYVPIVHLDQIIN